MMRSLSRVGVAAGLLLCGSGYAQFTTNPAVARDLEAASAPPPAPVLADRNTGQLVSPTNFALGYGAGDYRFIGVVPVSLAQGYPKSFGFKVSPDGTNWQTLLYNTSFVGSNANERIFAPWMAYRGTNFVVCWDAFALSGGAGLIGEAVSPDLVRWTRVPGFITNGAAMGNVFGGTFFTEGTNLYNILPAQAGDIYVTRATNAAGTAWGPTNRIAFGVRDAGMIVNNGTYWLFAVTNNSQITILTNRTGPTNQFYQLVANALPQLSVEAAEVHRLGSNDFILYTHANPGGVQKEMYSKSSNLVTWTAPQEINENGTLPGRMSVMELGLSQKRFVAAIVHSNAAAQPFQQVYYLTTGPGSLTATSQARPFGGVAAATIRYDVVAIGGQTNADTGPMAFQALVARFNLSQALEQDGQIPGTLFTNGPVIHSPLPVRPNSGWNAEITFADAGSGAVNNSGWNTGPMLKVTSPASTWVRWKVTETLDVVCPQMTNALGTAISFMGYGYDDAQVAQSENVAAYAAGTVYTLTATAAQVDFGTTDPAVTLPGTGTYLISGSAHAMFVGTTYSATNHMAFKLRRTNNTAADLSNSSRLLPIAVITTVTGDGGTAVIPPTFYTGAAGDVIQLFGNVRSLPDAGTVRVDSAEIVAVRLY